MVAQDEVEDLMRRPPELPQLAPRLRPETLEDATHKWAEGSIRDRSEDLGSATQGGPVLISINAGGWRTHGDTIMTSVPSQAMVCIQETLLTERATETC